MNLYAYVEGNPVTLVDINGLEATLGPVLYDDPKFNTKNTIVCDGKGGIKIHIGKCGGYCSMCGMRKCLGGCPRIGIQNI